MDGLDAWITPAILIGGFAFIWQQNAGMRRDIGDLRERMTKIGGLFEDFTKCEAP